MKTKLPCEGVIILQALKRRLEGLIGGEFEDDVMVLGVKPLRHFHDRDVAAAIASRHDEVGVESGAHIPKIYVTVPSAIVRSRKSQKEKSPTVTKESPVPC